MAKVKLCFQHIFNPLHVYCRLRDCGLSAGAARSVSRQYERYVFRFVRS